MMISFFMRNLRGYESKWFHDPANDVDGCVFFVAKFHEIAKKNEGGQWKAFIILGPLLYFFTRSQPLCELGGYQPLMDGLDPLSPESDGHDFLVVTLFVECKTHHHLTQAPFFTTFIAAN